LAKAIAKELPSLRPLLVDLDSSSRVSIARNKRTVSVVLALEERLFLSSFVDRDVCLGGGKTRSLRELAQTAEAWLIREVNTKVLTEQYPSVERSGELVELLESGRIEEFVQAHWEGIREAMPELAAFVELATRDPVLRLFMPYTSLNRLSFRRCIGVYYPGDCPMVETIPNGYRVLDTQGRALGEGNTAKAVNLVIQHLPAHAGPATW